MFDASQARARVLSRAPPWLLLIGLLTYRAPARAQEALVLSGGGARGLAHVGVVLQLQALGYDPDLVVGTSVGAVVGALYAAGYHPDEIRRRVLSVRWGEMFDPTPLVIGPDRTLRLPAFTFDLNVGHLRISRGLFGQWRVNRALARLLFDANVRSRGNFDQLARRFRAVATDLNTGEGVVLDSGDLARAVRASMAYPGFFAPVMWGDRVLVDGAIYDNFPTAIARELGATRIVGVDVNQPPQEVSSLAPFSVIQRALNLMQRNLQRDTLPLDGLVLVIDDGTFAGPTFPEDPLPLIERGLAAARRDLRPLDRLDPPAPRSLPAPPVTLSALVLEAPDSALGALARRIFADVISQPYDANLVLAAIDRLFSTGLLEGVWPRVDSTAESSSPPLVVRLDAPPTQSVSVAVQYENDRGGRAWASLDRYDRLGLLPAIFSASLSADGLERWGALSARVYSLRWPTIAYSLGAHIQEREVRTFSEDTRTVAEVVRAGGWVALEFPHILRERLLTALARAEWVDVEGGRKGVAFGPLLRFTSVLPDPLIVGTPLLIEAERRWGSLSYTRLTFSGSLAAPTRRPRLAAMMDLRAVSSRAPADVLPALGDDHAIPGLRWGEQRGRARVVAGVEAAYPVRTGFFRLRLRTGAVADHVDEWTSSSWVSGALVGAYWPSPIGVVEAGFGRATIGDGRFEVSVGRRF